MSVLAKVGKNVYRESTIMKAVPGTFLKEGVWVLGKGQRGHIQWEREAQASAQMRKCDMCSYDRPWQPAGRVSGYRLKQKGTWDPLLILCSSHKTEKVGFGAGHSSCW